MRFAKTLAGFTLTTLASLCSIVAAQAAPLPTNIGAMKAMVADDTVQQVRWGGGWGYRGGFGGVSRWPGLSRRRLGLSALGWRRCRRNRRRRHRAQAATMATAAAIRYYGFGGYYGGGYAPVYSGGYAYEACPPYGGGYGYSYRRYYGW